MIDMLRQTGEIPRTGVGGCAEHNSKVFLDPLPQTITLGEAHPKTFEGNASAKPRRSAILKS